MTKQPEPVTRPFNPMSLTCWFIGLNVVAWRLGLEGSATTWTCAVMGVLVYLIVPAAKTDKDEEKKTKKD